MLTEAESTMEASSATLLTLVVRLTIWSNESGDRWTQQNTDASPRFSSNVGVRIQVIGPQIMANDGDITGEAPGGKAT